MSKTDLAGLEREAFHRLAHYTRSIDAKDWTGLSEVFAADCVKERLSIDGLSCEAVITGGEAIIADIAASLGICGPTQHLLGNHTTQLCDGGEVESLTYVRAFHRGSGQKRSLWLDIMGEYRVRWRPLSEGLRAVRWSLRIFDSIGDPKAVSPS